METLNPRQRLVAHVQELERLDAVKRDASRSLKEYFDAAKRDGYDTATLKVVLKLRRMTSDERRERRALEAIYMAALGMLEGEPLTEEARRRLDRQPEDREDKGGTPMPERSASDQPAPAAPRPAKPSSPQQPLVLKTPEEARGEGATAAAAGKRVYDNPYPAGDPCRAAWDEGWAHGRRPGHVSGAARDRGRRAAAAALSVDACPPARVEGGTTAAAP